MHQLARTLRLCINPIEPKLGESTNGFAGAPVMRGLGRWYVFTMRCRGTPNPRTGYLVDIKTLDRAGRDAILPILGPLCRDAPESEPMLVVGDLFAAVDERLPIDLEELRWELTPHYSVTRERAAVSSVILRQQFDLSAAHRLHVPDLSDDENRRAFGKCNNPNGHGHNYRVEPAVEVGVEERPSLTLAQLERLVDDTIVTPYDHTHLNLDTEAFGASGVNPSVEHIARVFFEVLAPAIDAASSGGARLRGITVWETDRTSATYEPAA